MKPDYFKSQLQAVLTTYYEDIKGVQDGSGCHKTRIVKRRFEDQEDDAGNEGADAADAGAGAGAVDAGAGVVDASAQLSAGAAGGGGGGRRLQLLYRLQALSGRRGHGLLRRRLLRLMLIKLLYLNLNGRNTRQQPVPAYRPASRANQKAAAKRMIYQCTYPVQQCLYIS